MAKVGVLRTVLNLGDLDPEDVAGLQRLINMLRANSSGVIVRASLEIYVEPGNVQQVSALIDEAKAGRYPPAPMQYPSRISEGPATNAVLSELLHPRFVNNEVEITPSEIQSQISWRGTTNVSLSRVRAVLKDLVQNKILIVSHGSQSRCASYQLAERGEEDIRQILRSRGINL